MRRGQQIMEEEERKREQEEEEMIAAQSLVDALEAEVERFLARCTADDVVILWKRLSTICMPRAKGTASKQGRC